MDLNITNTTVLSIQFEAWKAGTFPKLDTNEQHNYFPLASEECVFLNWKILMCNVPFSPVKLCEAVGDLGDKGSKLVKSWN